MLVLLGLLGSAFVFWPLLFVLVLIGGWTAEDEHYVWSMILMIAIGALVYFGFPMAVEVFSHPIKLAMIVGGYVVAGVTWSTFKWYMRLRKVLNQFTDIRDEYLRDNNLPAGYFAAPIEQGSEDKVLRKHHEDFAKKIDRKMAVHTGARVVVDAHSALRAVQPKIWENKSRVITWGVYWPTSVVWFVLADFIKEVIETIYSAVSGRLQAMSDAMFKDAL